MNHFIICVSLLILFTVTPGCSSRATIDGWQQRLERQAHIEGDMSFLRDSSLASRHPKFSVIGSSDPDKSSDVHGILLGRHMIRQSPWLVFLVANVKNRQVQDIRVAIRHDQPGSHETDEPWIWSEEDEQSTQTYLRFRDSAWRRNHPNRSDRPLHALDFPGEGDVYRLEIAGNTVSVVEERSGVRWTLVLNQQHMALAAAPR